MKSSAKNGSSNWVLIQGAIFMVSIVISGLLSFPSCHHNYFNDNVNTYTTLLDIANMPSLHDRRVQDMCILIFKVIHGTTPTPLRTLLTLRSKSCNLRGKLILVQPRVITTKYGLNTFRYYGPKIWNSLNDELRTSPTLKTFVTRIRKITFDACNCSLCNC